MAKKTSKVTTTGSKKQDKAVFQMRLRRDLHERLTEEAKAAGCSLNELIQGICEGVVPKLMRGWAERDQAGIVVVKERYGCISFGEAGVMRRDEDRKEEYDETGSDPGPKLKEGEVWFKLGFHSVVAY